MTGFPPEPWRLRCDATVTLWLVPRRLVARQAPPGTRLVTLADRAVVGTAWIDYRPGGVLTYRELLAAVLVRDGVRPLVTIPAIWVDDEASLAGGRALWHIPKDLARLAIGDTAASADVATGGVATARLRRGRALPIPLPARFTVAQPGRRSPVRVTGRPAAARAVWTFDPDGPLAWLRGARRVATIALTGADLVFGRRDTGPSRPSAHVTTAPAARAAPPPVSGVTRATRPRTSSARDMWRGGCGS